jgi:hypothetical protein
MVILGRNPYGKRSITPRESTNNDRQINSEAISEMCYKKVFASGFILGTIQNAHILHLFIRSYESTASVESVT